MATPKKSKTLLAAIDEACAGNEPATSTENFMDALLVASKTDGTKPIKYPAEILSPHVDARLRGGHWTPAGAKTLSAIVKDADLCPAGDLEKLRGIQKEYAALAEKQLAFTLVQANRLFDGQRHQLAERAKAGDLPTENGNQFRSREDIQTDFRQKWSAIGAVLDRLSKQAADLALPVWEGAAKAVFDSMQAVENSERATAAKFDVTWTASTIFKAHATVLMQCHKRIEALKNFRHGANGYSHASPHNFLEPLIEI